MENKLPMKYENGFFKKIRKFLSNILRKDSIVTEHIKVIKTEKNEIKSKENEFDKMKVGSNKVKVKEDIITLIDKNPELIETLSLDKLEELERMYDEIIERNDRKIKQLKRAVS